MVAAEGMGVLEQLQTTGVGVGGGEKVGMLVSVVQCSEHVKGEANQEDERFKGGPGENRRVRGGVAGEVAWGRTIWSTSARPPCHRAPSPAPCAASCLPLAAMSSQYRRGKPLTFKLMVQFK
jgi:hypothetical protein